MAVIASGLSLIVVVVVIAFAVLGPTRFWRLLGDPDLGNVSFETLQRRSSPNDALACPPDTCKARSDITTVHYRVQASELRTAFAAAVASEPRLSVVENDSVALTDRYIQRSKWLGFPDTIVVRFFDRPDGQSTLALYSRSKFGEGDLGVNRARIERWLAKLATVVPPSG